MKRLHFEQVLEQFPKFGRFEMNLKAKESAKYPLSVLASIQERVEQNYPDGIPSGDFGTVMTPRFSSYWIYFQITGRPIYKMAREFSHELSKVKLDVATGNIPYGLPMFCVEFPEDMRFDLGDEKFAHCVYIFTTEERGTTDDGTLAKRYIQFTIPLYDKDGNLTLEIQEFGVPVTDLAQTFEQAAERAHGHSTINHMNRDFVNFCLNCLLYICSGDPDLRDNRAQKPPQTRKAKQLRKWHREHNTLDVMLVGYNFKKPITYNVGSTTVSGHFRWQPYGTGRQQVKLIWIDAHERHFKQEQSA
jgi:hypothetical protein